MRAFVPLLLMTCLGLTAASSAAPLVTSDNFSDGDYTSNPAWTVNAGTWDASTGELRQTALTSPNARSVPAKTISLNGVTETTPYTTIVADMKIETAIAPGNDFIGIAFRMQSASDMYAIFFFPDWASGGGDLQMARITSGGYTQIGLTINMAFAPGAGVYSTMTLQIQPSNQFVVTVQSGANSKTTTFTDSALTNGGIGLINSLHSTGDASVFDNVSVWVPEPAAATTATLMFSLLLRRKCRPQ